MDSKGTNSQKLAKDREQLSRQYKWFRPIDRIRPEKLLSGLYDDDAVQETAVFL